LKIIYRFKQKILLHYSKRSKNTFLKKRKMNNYSKGYFYSIFPKTEEQIICSSLI
jgi:hypothetical protein